MTLRQEAEMKVSDDIVSEFKSSGVAVIREAFVDWMDTLRKGVSLNVEAPSADGRTYVGKNGGGMFLSDFCNWQRIPEYRDFIFNSDAGSIAAQLMESRSVRLFHEHVLVKEASADVATPWHQDQPCYCVGGPKTVSLWIPLDEVPRDTTPEFIAGSHLWGKLFKPLRFNGQDLNPDDGLEVMPDINSARDDYDIRGWHLRPGDAVAFDYRTIHGAPANIRADRQRRAFSLRLVGEGATFARRPGVVTSPPFKGVEMPDGSALSDPYFPTVYPSEPKGGRPSL
jgi:ectoine hydroxylase-related dioxygenase (phytanoyl-CoA dioxygenase family)